jgi:ubiquinol-cytochrome c reductase cytochrome c1 subunit
MLKLNIKPIKTIGIIALVAIMASGSAMAAGGSKKPKEVDFSQDGPFGTFDQAQLQRGFKVFREVCSNCHSISLMSFRNLGQKGGPFYDKKYKNPNDNPYVKQIASEYDIAEVDTETGDMTTRKGMPSDRFPLKYANVYAAAASNGGAIPPDLSVITKARKGGAEYIYSLLSGYVDPPKGLKVGDNQHYNPYMPGDLKSQWSGDPHKVPKGGVLAMAAPLANGTVTFDDGSKSTVDQQSKDVAAFLEWVGDPHAVERKQTGFGVLIYLFLFGIITYVAYRQVWGNKH